MEYHSSSHTGLSTEAQAGSYISNAHTRRRRRELPDSRAERLNEWSTSGANDHHINDRLACSLAPGGFTTKDYLAVASETISQFDQSYCQGYDANADTGVNSTVCQSMYPLSIELAYLVVDQEVYSSTSLAQGGPDRDNVTSIHGTTQGYSTAQGSTAGFYHGHKSDSNQVQDPTPYQKAF